MFQGKFADQGDKMFDEDTAKIVRRHAFWGAFVMFFPLFGIDWVFFICILWHMYKSLAERADLKLDIGNVIFGLIVNIIIGIGLDLVLSFIPIIGWLGTSFIVYLQFYFSGKMYLESIKFLRS